MPAFHDLTVAAVQPLTDDSRLVTLVVPERLTADYAFRAGQHLTFRFRTEGVEQRRTYSICAAPGSRRLEVAVKLLPNGEFSRLVQHVLTPGDVVSVMTPVGRFGRRRSLDGADATPDARRYLAVVAGSGVTPVLSIMTDVLSTEPASEFVLVYGNRTTASTMFADRIQDLQHRYRSRLTIYPVLSREHLPAALLSGRIDKAALDLILERHPPDQVDEWLLCGPSPLVALVRSTLAERGVDRRRVHSELFYSGEPTDPTSALL